MDRIPDGKDAEAVGFLFSMCWQKVSRPLGGGFCVYVHGICAAVDVSWWGT